MSAPAADRLVEEELAVDGEARPHETPPARPRAAMRHVPNLLTLLRLALVPCFLGASMQGMYTVAFALFVGAALTDILDGALARRFNVRSRLGALLDPAADKTLMVCGFVYYTFADLPVVALPVWLTFAVFVRDLLIATFAYLMYTRIRIDRFPPSLAGKISTVLQAVTISVAIAVNAFLPMLLPAVNVLFKLSLLMTLASGWGYLRRAALLLQKRFAEEA